MSTKVENKIVSMQFDNKDFEKNVSTSMSTIDKLKSKLSFSGATKGLNDISTAANKVSFNPIGKAADAVILKMSAMQIAAITAMSNMVTSAMSTGQQMIKSLTIDPVAMGFNEYETKINSIQTIMANTASKGTTMEQVTAVIDELNTYADKTIYNFAEMTRNIGTFTAAGVGLEESAAAIQGIANLAATSGSNSQQASTAMYQLSQALATGTVKLMDWNSVVNAGMGGEVFQNALKQTAREMGISVDKIIEKNGSFRDSLQEGWLTADVLNTTLNNFTKDGAANYAEAMLKSGEYTQEQADALMEQATMMEDAATKVKTFTQLMSTLQESVQSGWGKTFELVIGDFESAKTFFTDVSNLLGGMIGESADARNDILAEAFNVKSVSLDDWKKLAKEAGSASEEFKQSIIDTAREQGVNVDYMIESYGDFENSLEAGWVTAEVFNEAIKNTTTTIGDNAEEMGDFEKVVNEVIRGLYGNGAQRMTELTEAGWDYATVQGLVNDLLLRGESNWDKLSEAELKNLGYTQEQTDALAAFKATVEETGTPLNEMVQQLELVSGRALFHDSVLNGLEAFVKIAETVKTAWAEVFPPASAEQVYNILEAINEFSKKLILSDENSDKLGRTLKGLFSILGLITDIVFEVAKFGFGLFNINLGDAGDATLEFTARIGDNITAFRDWLKSTEFISKTLTVVGDVIKYVVTSIGQFSGAVGQFVLATPQFANFQNVMEAVKETIEDFGETGEISFDKIKKAAKKADPFAPLGESADKATSGISSIFDTLIETIGNFNKQAQDVVGDVDTGDFVAIGLTGGFVAGIVGLFQNMTRLVDILDKVADVTKVIDSISDTFLSLSKLISTFQKKQQAEIVYTYAKAITALAISLFILSKIPAEDLERSMFAMGAMAGMLILVASAMKALSNTADPKSTGVSIGMLIGISASMLILAISIQLVKNLNPEQLLTSFLTLLGMMGLLVAAVLIISSKAKQAITGAGVIIALSASMLLMVLSIKMLADMNPGKVQDAIVQIGILLLVLVAALYGVSKAQSGVVKGGLAILLITVSIGMLVALIKIIQLISFGEAVSGALFISVFLGILITAMLILAQGRRAVTKGGATMLALSIALGVLVIVMKLIATMSIGEIAKGLVVVTAILAIFTVVILFSKFAGADAHKAGAMILAMSISLGLLVGVIAVLTLLDPVKVQFATNIISQIFIMFGIVIAASKLANNATKVIIPITIAIATLAGAVALLSFLPADQVKGAAESLTMIMIAMAILMATTKLIKTSDLPQALIMLGLLTLVIGALGLILWGLTENITNVDSAIKIASSLTLMLLGMGVVLGVLTVVGLAGPAALIGVASLIAAIVAITAMVTALGFLFTQELIPLDGYLDKGLDVLQRLGSGLGSAIGNFVGGILEGITDSLPAVGNNLSTFMTNLEPFIDGLDRMDETKVTAAAAVAGMILALMASDVLAAITGWLTGGADFGQFGSELEAYGESLVAFAESVEGLDPTYINIAVEASEGIVALAKTIPNSGGLLGVFMGENTFAELKIGLVDYGTALVKFGETVEGVKTSAIESAVDASKGIVEVANTIPNSGGWLGKLAGENNFSQLKIGLVDYGKAMVEFGNKVEGAKIDAIAAAVEASKGIVAVADTIPNSGGLLSVFSGDNDFATFGTQLVAYGEAIKGFGTKVTDLNTEPIETAVKATEQLVDLQSGLENMGGVAGFFAGNDDLGAFGNSLVKYGEALVDFQGAIEGVSLTRLESSATASLILAEMMDVIGDGNTDASDFAGSLKDLGTALAAYMGNIEEYDTVSMNASVTAISRLATTMTTVSELDYSNIGSFVQAIKDLGEVFSEGLTFDSANADAVSASIKGIIDTIQNGLTEQIPNLSNPFSIALSNAIQNGVDKSASDMQFEGKEIADGLGIGIVVGTSSVENAIIRLFAMVSITTKNKAGEFNKEGQNLVDNLTNGINGTSYKAETAIRSLINSIINNLNSNASKFRSPGERYITELSNGMNSKAAYLRVVVDGLVNTITSKFDSTAYKFTSTGRTIVENLANGMNNSKWNVSGAANGVVSSIESTINNNLSLYQAGKDAIQGLANGMRNNTYIARNAASYVANEVIKKTKQVFDEHSPSKVFEGIGEFLPPGLANGIYGAMAIAVAAAKDLGDGVNKAAEDTMNGSNPFTNLFDANQPVIRPVVDLTNVKDGVKAVGSIFGGTALNASGSYDMAMQSIPANQHAQQPISSTTQNTYEVTIVTQATDAVSVAKEVSKAMNDIANGVVNTMTKKVQVKSKIKGV